MAISVVKGMTRKSSISVLADVLTEASDLTGQAYTGYPILNASDERSSIDAIWISEKYGVVVFDCVDGRSLSDYKINDVHDELYAAIQARLLVHKELLQKRQLQIPIRVVTFAPGVVDDPAHGGEEYKICNQETLIGWLRSCAYDYSSEVFKKTLSVIQALSNLRRPNRERMPQKTDSRGAILKRLEDQIATLDNHQAQAVLQTVKGVQRIRGLAGSGKTVVLALKAAYLYCQNPDWMICVTFSTRSLKVQLKQLITRFILSQAGEEPDWNRLKILHAWGASGGGDRGGLYYNFCQMNNLRYYDFMSAQVRFGEGREFEGACAEAMSRIQNWQKLYDAILVDEAQDLPPSFLRLCYEMLGEDRRLVYAYDELQNLAGKSMPSPEEIFGTDSKGQPLVTLKDAEQDVILKKCYRNSRPVLSLAHALGFGIYREGRRGGTGIVQMFEHYQLWQDVGYAKVSGELKDGSPVVLTRTKESSPLFLEDHSPLNDLIKVQIFDTIAEQTQWIVDGIKKNIVEEELLPSDIVVINPNPYTTRKRVSVIRAELAKLGIKSHLAGVDTSPDVFFGVNNDSVTFTGVFRAKGNEAGMVYVINAEECAGNEMGCSALARNQLFTAITRSKAWVRISGVRPGMDVLAGEIKKTIEKGFVLDFKCPTSEERKFLNIVNRDMTKAERDRIDNNKRSLDQILEDLRSGRLCKEDFDQDQILTLKELLIGSR